MYTKEGKNGAYLVLDDIDDADLRKVEVEALGQDENSEARWVVTGEAIERFHKLEKLAKDMDELIQDPKVTMSAREYHAELKRRLR